jgi:hypothetical protein
MSVSYAISHKYVWVAVPNAQDLGGIPCHINDGGRHFGDQVTIDNCAEVFSPCIFDFVRIIEVIAFAVVDGQVEQGCFEHLDELEDDIVVGDANAHFFPLGLKGARDLFGGFQDECIGAGKDAFGNPEGPVAKIAVLRYLLKVATEQSSRLFLGAVEELEHPLDSFGSERVTAHSVACVCRIYDNFPTLHEFYELLELAWLGMIWVEDE